MGSTVSSILPVAGTAAGAFFGGPAGAMIGSQLGSTLGGALSGSAANNAANQQATAFRNTANQAAANTQFKPFGMTTNFGTSNYVYDPTTGQMTSAGYTLSPQLQGMQTGLMNAAANYNYQPDVGFINGVRQNSLAGMQMAMQQAPNAFNAGNQLYAQSKDLYPQGQTAFNQGNALFRQGEAVTAQSPGMFANAQDLYGTGASYLGSAAQAEADYMNRTRAALAGGDEQTLARLRNQVYSTGRAGLATGGTTTGMLAANPELAAYYNSLQQRDLDMATKAQAEGRTNVALGATLYGQGGNLQTQAAGVAGTGANIQGVGGQLFNVGANQYDTAGRLVSVGNQSLNTGANLLTTSSQLGTNAINQEMGKYQLQNAALNTLGNYLGQANTMQNMGQGAYNLSQNMGTSIQGANQQAGQMQMQGQTQAAPYSYGASATSNLGQFLSGAGGQMAMQGGANALNPWFNGFLANITAGPSNVYGYGGQGTVPTTTTGMD
jgi:hypothetical protein